MKFNPIKSILVGAVSILVLTGQSCLAPRNSINRSEPIAQITQRAVYYLPVNQQSAQFKDVLVPAGSKVVGCNDYLTLRQGAEVTVPDRAALLSAALQQQLTLTLPDDDFYYNPLPQYAPVRIDSVIQEGDVMEVRISGQFSSPGACADPVIKGMIQETIKEYSSSYRIFLNGTEANWRCLFDQSGQCI